MSQPTVRRLLLPVGSGLLLALLGLGYLLADGRLPRHAPTGNDDDPISLLLDLAGRAEAEHRLVAPAGRNACEFYLSALALEPDRAAVREALTRLVPAGAAVIEQAINQGELDEAQRELRLLREYDAGNFTLALLAGKLDARRRLEVQRDEAVARAMQAHGGMPAQPR